MCNVGAVTGASSGEPGRWRTFGTREIYGSPELWLGQLDVELPDGERVWEHVVRLPQAALMALLDDQRRVLLVWRHRFVPDKWGWELPGGQVDEDEDPAEAAVRELEDTTGYRAGRLDHLITLRPLPETVDSEQVAFVGRDPVHEGEPTAGGNVARVEWVSLGSVLGLIAEGHIWHAGTLVALLRLLTMDGLGVSH